MKLKLIHDFTLEVNEDTYTGTFKDLTKKQVKSIDKLTPTKELKELKKLERREKTEKVYDRIDELREIVGAFDTEDIYKKRLELSLGGDDKKAIMAIGEEIKNGYQRVFDTIMEDIAEGQKGND